MHQACLHRGCPLPRSASEGARGWLLHVHPSTLRDTRTSVCPHVKWGQFSNAAARLRSESTANAESSYRIKRYYSQAKLLLFPFIHDSADVPGNAKGLLFPAAKVPLHDGDGNKSPTLPFAGARSA